MIEQQEAQDALLRRAETASAVALAFGDKRDEFGREMTKLSRFDPDRTAKKSRQKSTEKSHREIAQELYPFLFTGKYDGGKN